MDVATATQGSPSNYSSVFTMRSLFDAGVHFGHSKGRWNPQFGPYLYGVRDKIHIIDLEKTAPLLLKALKVVEDDVAGGGKILFVGTKKQARDSIQKAAMDCEQHYVAYRWLGGMLTNWNTVSKSIKRMEELESQLKDQEKVKHLTKKEKLTLTRQYEKLEKVLGGIRHMKTRPQLLFVVDVIKESNAVQEALKLNMPIVGVVDSNANPSRIKYPIPGNDDSSKALELYCQLVAEAVKRGQKKLQAKQQAAKIGGK